MSSDARTTRLIAIRHGETAWNLASRLQGHLNVALNDTGRLQADRLAQALAGERIHAIYSSDLTRARHTARPLAHAAGLDVRADKGLRERSFGIFEGLSYAEIEQRFPEQARRWHARDTGFEPEGGETLAAFCARAVGAVTAIAARHRGQHIVVVTHGGVLDALYRAAAHMALDAQRNWPLGNASINRLLARDEGFELVGWADDLHLAERALDETSDKT